MNRGRADGGSSRSQARHRPRRVSGRAPVPPCPCRAHLVGHPIGRRPSLDEGRRVVDAREVRRVGHGDQLQLPCMGGQLGDNHAHGQQQDRGGDVVAVGEGEPLRTGEEAVSHCGCAAGEPRRLPGCPVRRPPRRGQVPGSRATCAHGPGPGLKRPRAARAGRRPGRSGAERVSHGPRPMCPALRVYDVAVAGRSAVGDAWPGAAGRVRTMVRPPPGVSSASSVPPMASAKPRATARPSPTPAPRGASP